MHSMFNDDFEHMDDICTAEFEDMVVMMQDPMEERKSKIAHKTFQVRDLGKIPYAGMDYDDIKFRSDFASSYCEIFATAKKVKLQQKANETRFGLISIFGYKHSSANKLYAYML